MNNKINLRLILALCALGIVLSCMAAQARWSMFIIAGQSNAQGYCGDSSWSGNAELVPGTAYEYLYDSDGLRYLRDPVGEESGNFMAAWTGSMAPNFCRVYHQLTGDTVVIIHTAMLGAGLHAKAGGLWLALDRKGLITDCCNIAHAAMNTTGLGLSGIVWCQGEADAVAINADQIKAEEYKAALIALIDSFRTEFSNAELPFYIIQTGTLNRSFDSLEYDRLAYGKSSTDFGFEKVRAMQAEACAADSFTVMVHNRALEFAGDGWMADTWHYYQNGHNEIGIKSAENIVKYKLYGQDLAVESSLGIQAISGEFNSQSPARRPAYRRVCFGNCISAMPLLVESSSYHTVDARGRTLSGIMHLRTQHE